MKCPQCGHWNKPSFPHCFQCGHPLNARAEGSSKWRETFERGANQGKKRVVYDDTVTAVENLVDGPPARSVKARQIEQSDEPLAEEMTRLKDRRARGMEYQRQLRENAAAQGIAPSGTGVSVGRGKGFFSDVPDDPEETVQIAEPSEAELEEEAARFYEEESTADIPRASRRNARQRYVAPEYAATPYDDLPPLPDAQGPITPLQGRPRRRKVRGPLLIAYALVGILILAVGFVGYLIISSMANPDGLQRSEVTSVGEYGIVPFTTEGGLAAHRISVPSEEGSLIYIGELGKSYVVVNGFATFEIEDHFFYDSIEHLEAESMNVVLTPSLVRSGEQTRLEEIRYTISIPDSPIELIQPEAREFVVNSSIYTIKLMVKPGSHVTINGRDASDMVSDTGLMTYNPSVQAIGNNIFSIAVKAPYCRENSLTIVLYRERMEIPLEIDGATITQTDEDTLNIYLTTDPLATITVDTPHESIDTSTLLETGRVSVKAKFTKVGNNTVIIRASMEGKKDSILEHTVYYLPPADTYTRKAWGLSRSEYNNLMNNIKSNIERAQIYVCEGVVTKIVSTTPQLVIMDTSTEAGREQLVFLENAAVNKVWKLGGTYKVYGDVSGVYNDMPRLMVRYSYVVEEPEEEPTEAPTDEGGNNP